MTRSTFIVLAIVLMALVGFSVRAGIERTDPPQQTGPATPQTHDIQSTHANCLGCHGNITTSHDAKFGAGNYSDCLSCHPQR